MCCASTVRSAAAHSWLVPWHIFATPCTIRYGRGGATQNFIWSVTLYFLKAAKHAAAEILTGAQSGSGSNDTFENASMLRSGFVHAHTGGFVVSV